MRKITLTISGNLFGETGYISRSIYDPIADLGGDLLGFFDAEEASSLTVDTEGDVTRWDSLVGDFALTPFNMAHVPQRVVDGWAAGIPCVRFTAAAGVNGTVLTNQAGPVNDAGMTAFVVARRGVQLDGAANRIRPVLQLPAALENNIRQQAFLGVLPPAADAGQSLVFAGQYTGSGSQNQNSTAPGLGQGEKGLLYGEFPNADAIRARVDAGGAGAAKPWFDVPNVSTWSLGGMRNAGDASFSGDILMALIIKGVPDEARRQKIEGYCAWRAGINEQIPTSHPYAAEGPYSE
ncbi:hypothetical protein CHH26_09450 [Qipengyuania flava]|uniref:hypothetical protein n=1 Tax=Qipengyuania flava TaxID=192812 RepID=UPI000B8C33F2|nr:hypothetical protein [Qipengyuania flava]ASP30422.1 hypothetical protein CHH26_09450 [Qipengyuania flava]